MRIDYGLSTTSLSSLLHKDSSPSSITHGKDTAKDRARESPPTKDTKEGETHKGAPKRETFGLEILAKMSEKEYQVFLRASEGLSDVEKMAAAQALYVFTAKSARESKKQEEAEQPPLNPESTQDSSPLGESTPGPTPLESKESKKSKELKESKRDSLPARDSFKQAEHVPPSRQTPSRQESLAQTPRPAKNPYFSAQEHFITRYVALYNGAQEVDITS